MRPEISRDTDEAYNSRRPALSGALGVSRHQPDRGQYACSYQTRRAGRDRADCARREREKFSLADERQAIALAAHAGRAVLNARLSAEAQRRQRWMAVANTLTIRLLSDKEAEPIDVITDEAALAADADIAILSIPHGEHQLVVCAASGLRGSELISTSWPKSRPDVLTAPFH